MSSADPQNPEVQPVQEGHDDVLHAGIQTNNEKEESGIHDETHFEVQFRAGDPINPKEWSSWRRAWALFCIAFSSFVVSLYSTIYTSSIPGVSKAFDIHVPVIPTLGITTYLIGTGAGSLIQAPLSEVLGRRPIYLVSMSVFTLLILPCSLATSVAEILIVRFFG